MRRRLRDAGGWLVVAWCIAVLGGIAWLTRHPDHAVLEAVADWPVLGRWAQGFTERYLPPAGGQPREVVVDGFFDLPESRERDGAMPWSRSFEPWEGSGPPPLGMEPVPPLPLPGRPADPRRLQEARSVLTRPEARLQLGPYPLYTDVTDRALVRVLDLAASQIEARYLSRYGVQPIGEAAESVVLYRSEQSYRAFQQRWERLRGLQSRGHQGFGLVALYAGDQSARDVTGALVHEIAHLLNRRALGPALPSWLDEGIAEDLGSLHIDEAGELVEAPWEALRADAGERVELRGLLASLDRLAGAARLGRLPSLPTLLDLDWPSFVAEPRASLNYAASVFLVRFLLAPESRLASGFRSFLDGIAGGDSASPDALYDHLGVDGAALETRWRQWLAARIAEAGVGEGLTLIPSVVVPSPTGPEAPLPAIASHPRRSALSSRSAPLP